jgi:hypothetical protein
MRAEFHRREEEQSVARLPHLQRLVLCGGRLLTGSKVARAAAVAYMLLLHLLTMHVLMSSSHASAAPLPCTSALQ